MRKKFYLLLITSLLLASCNPVHKILESGRLTETTFIEKIPFTFEYGLPIVKVEIDGKSYSFLFDTGAPTVIGPDLQALLKLKSETVGKTSDSQGNSGKQAFVKIPTMKIGALTFQNIGAMVIDVKKVFEFKCLNFDGIIGANQMEKAVWQIDYQNKIITGTNDIANLVIPKNAEILKFNSKTGQKTPKLPIKIGKRVAEATFDTGATGDFSVPFQIYKEDIATLNGVEAFGSSGTGIYGKSKNSLTTYKKVPSFTIGGMRIGNQIVTFTEGTTAIIGNSFLKNYRLILDWKKNSIYMIKETELPNGIIENFGIGLRYINNKPTVSKIFKGTNAEKSGIQINDQIVAVDDRDVSNLTEAEACYYTFNNILFGKNTRTITALRNGEKLRFNLVKALILH